MTEMMKQKEKKGDDIWVAYDKILETSPSPIEKSVKSLIFLWMYFFVQENLDHKGFTKQLIGIGINPLDICYFVEEVEKNRNKLKKNVLPIQYVPQ